MSIGTITFKAIMTSGAFPEQYEVYCPEWGDKQVGYMRLRGGWFCVECPDALEKIVFEHTFENQHLGEFPDDETRARFVGLGLKAISEWLSDNPDFINLVRQSSNLMLAFNPVTEIETGRGVKNLLW